MSELMTVINLPAFKNTVSFETHTANNGADIVVTVPGIGEVDRLTFDSEYCDYETTDHVYFDSIADAMEYIVATAMQD